MTPTRGAVGPDGDRSADSDARSALRPARERISDLATEDGAFAVACRETGVSPVPVTTATFATYRDAERARDAATAYRDALERLDPELPAYDLAVCDVTDGSVELASVRERTDERRSNGLPRSRRTVTLAGGGDEEWLRIENGPVVHFHGPETRLDDEVVARQLDAKLD